MGLGSGAGAKAPLPSPTAPAEMPGDRRHVDEAARREGQLHHQVEVLGLSVLLAVRRGLADRGLCSPPPPRPGSRPTSFARASERPPPNPVAPVIALNFTFFPGGWPAGSSATISVAVGVPFSAVGVPFRRSVHPTPPFEPPRGTLAGHDSGPWSARGISLRPIYTSGDGSQ